MNRAVIFALAHAGAHHDRMRLAGSRFDFGTAALHGAAAWAWATVALGVNAVTRLASPPSPSR